MPPRISNTVFLAFLATFSIIAIPGTMTAQAQAPSQNSPSAKDDAKALSDLRKRLFETMGTDAEVVAEIERFTNADHPTAHFLMGEILRLGLGRATDPVQAVIHFEAALSGNVQGSAERLGMIQRVEDSPAFDPAKSVVNYRIAAEQGSQSARLALADAYAQGFGISPDPAEADRLYAELMQQGERAAARLGTLRFDAGNLEGAAEAWKTAAAAGRSEVLMRLGALLRDQLDDGPGAREVFLAARTAGIERADDALMLGDLNGTFGAASDTARAAQWLETEADLSTTLRIARALRDGNAVAVPAESIAVALARHDIDGAPAAASMLVQFYTRGTVDDNAPARAVVSAAMQRRLSATATADSLRSLSIVALRRNDFGLAADAMQRAAEAGDTLALPRLAVWHLRGQLGSDSDLASGIAFLKQAEPLNDPAAAQLIAGLLGNANIRTAADIPSLLKVLEASAKEGDSLSASLYLRVLRLGAVGDTARMAEVFVGRVPEAALTEEAELEYLLLRAGKSTGERSWKEIATRGSHLPDAQFARLLSGIRGVNPNVLTYTLQSRLAKEGYDGPLNGFLTPSTVRMILGFCKDNGILAQCRAGPLRASAVDAISNVFATRAAP